MLKSYVDHIAALYRLDLQRLEYLQAPTDIFEEGILYLVKQKVLACMGRVNRTCLNRLGIRQDVFFAEINWDLFYNMIRNNRNQFTDLPRFPEVHRDLALVVDQCISYRQLQGIAFKTEKRLLKSVGLFDVYTGKGIPEGKKQYALSLVFQDPQKTLTDACVEQITEHLLEAFRKEAGAVLR